MVSLVAKEVGNSAIASDATSGLYYYCARWYDPGTGGYIGEDPLGFAAGDTNLERYVGNSPVNFTDPSGLTPVVPPVYYSPPPFIAMRGLGAGGGDGQSTSQGFVGGGGSACPCCGAGILSDRSGGGPFPVSPCRCGDMGGMGGGGGAPGDTGAPGAPGPVGGGGGGASVIGGVATPGGGGGGVFTVPGTTLQLQNSNAYAGGCTGAPPPGGYSGSLSAYVPGGAESGPDDLQQGQPGSVWPWNPVAVWWGPFYGWNGVVHGGPTPWQDYKRYFWHPTHMDTSCQAGYWGGLGTAAVAGTAAAGCAFVGFNPWLGLIAIHGAHHGLGTHFEAILRVGTCRNLYIISPGKDVLIWWRIK